MQSLVNTQSRLEDSKYLGCVLDQETKRIDHYLAKASDTTAPLKNRKVAAKIAAALLESALLSQEQLPE